MKDYIKKTALFAVYKKLSSRYKRLKSDILNSMPAFDISYYFYSLENNIKNALFYNYKKKKPYKLSIKDIKSAIIVYSKLHFDPENDVPSRPLYYSGTASITRRVWNLFEGKERFFVDVKTRMKDVPKADVIIGLMSENFRLCAKANPKAKKILLLVNCHPLYRARVLMKEARDLHKRLPPTEWVSPKLFFSTRKYADVIALTGNKVIKDTYLDLGVKEVSVAALNTAINMDRIVPNLSLRPKDKIRFIYPASHKAIRKGLFRTLYAWKELNTMVPKDSIELYLVGGDEPSFMEDINDFIKEYPNVYNFPWVDIDTQLRFFQSSHAVIAPALEEGQVTTVLEVMACGAVPIITPECGIDIKDGIEGFMIKDYKDAIEIAEYMKKLVEDSKVRERMSSMAILNIQRQNNWDFFDKNIRRIVEEE